MSMTFPKGAIKVAGSVPATLFKMELLTTYKARRILDHPVINFAQVASLFYGSEKKDARQALRRRTLDREGEWTKKTLEKLTIIFSDLHHLLHDGDDQIF